MTCLPAYTIPCAIARRAGNAATTAAPEGALPVSTMRMQLIAVEHGSDRLIGEYTFNHTPWAQLQQT